MTPLSCDGKKGRIWNICAGVEDDGSPLKMKPEARLSYLKSFFPTASEEDIIRHVQAGMNVEQERKFGLGDLVAAGIKVASFGLIKPCSSCEERRKKLNNILTFGSTKKSPPSRSPFAMGGNSVRFIKSSQLQTDVLSLVGKIPSDVTAIAGISRSGLCVATMLAMYMHLPLFIIRQSLGDVVEGGNGWRLGGNAHVSKKPGRVLVVDDTVMTGNSFTHIRPLAERFFGRDRVLTAAVYVNPAAKTKPDLWEADLPWPHILEWNVFNSVLSPSMAVDFDGILCQDCPPGSDDDGPKYLDFIRNAKPLYLPRKVPIPLVVTARIEKYRDETQAWLERHGIRVRRLVMHPAATLRERMRDDIPAYKARHFVEFALRPAHIKPYIFFESEDHQARKIGAVASGADRVVICPATGGVY